jgi:peptide/nickel transport system substrate-binding protein
VQSYFRASPDIASGVFLSERLESLEALDELSLQMVFTEPLGFVLDGLATPWPQFNVLPEKIAQISTDEDIGEANTIGSGPYKLGEWLRGDKLVIERFEDFLARQEPSSGLYGIKHAYLDKIVYLEIPSMQTKIAGLETGQWDVVEDAALDFFEQLNTNSDIGLVYYRFAQSKMPLNTELAPTDNRAFRQALQAAVDVDYFMEAFAPKALWQLCHAQYYCNTGLETDGGSELYDQGDPDRAKALLTQAGYAGETFTIINPTDLASVGWMGQVAKPVFEDVGITVEMPSIDWATVQSIIATPNSDWNMSTTWYALWTTPNPVADTVPAGLQWGGSNWDVQGAKDLQYAYALASDHETQLAIIDELQVLLRTEVKEITLGQWSSITAHRSSVNGVIVPTMAIYFNTWIDK